MRSTRFLAVVFFVAACGGKGSTNDEPGDIDAPDGGPVCGDNTVEAPEECDDGNTTSGDGCSSTCTDEAAPLTGLLQKCGNGLPACPANASECVGLVAGGTTYCTPKCVVAGTATGAANNQFTAVNPAPNNGTCTAAFASNIGMPQCAVLFGDFVPADNPIVVGKNYTNVNFGCAVLCGAGQTCPPGNTCNTGIGGGVCLPQ